MFAAIFAYNARLRPPWVDLREEVGKCKFLKSFETKLTDTGLIVERSTESTIAGYTLTPVFEC